ncbi:hypothetical protein [Actinomycetospora aeridis]|uniref:Uncharacterized protein n=1 Tax=Actinomycetospora aeridis TaxID=3129231 RepID=A0ABU8N885_9PSEU
MTAPQEAGGPWLDMSRYPDTDPDAVLSPADQGLLTSALAVDEGELPDSVWEHMLAVVTGDTGDDSDDTDETAPDDPAADPLDDGGWGDDPAHTVEAHDPDDPLADPVHDSHDAHDWDGGAV